MDKGNTVRQAGGFIIQLMPSLTSDEVIDRLEAKLSEVESVTTMLDGGMTPEQILEELLGELSDWRSDRYASDPIPLQLFA